MRYRFRAVDEKRLWSSERRVGKELDKVLKLRPLLSLLLKIYLNRIITDVVKMETGNDDLCPFILRLALLFQATFTGFEDPPVYKWTFFLLLFQPPSF